jgi:hypothetical protein
VDAGDSGCQGSGAEPMPTAIVSTTAAVNSGNLRDCRAE